MDYWFWKNTPANTAKVNALETTIRIQSGIIRQLWLYFPEGCQALAHASIWLGAGQLFPTNTNDDYAGNGVPLIDSDESIAILKPDVLTLKTWNEDDAYEHRVFGRLTVASIAQPIILMKPQQIWQEFLDFLNTKLRDGGVFG